MESKTIFVVISLIMTFLSLSHPTLATNNDDDEPLLKSDDEFHAVFADSPSSRDYNDNVSSKYSKEHLDSFYKCAKVLGYVDSDKCFLEVMAQILRNKSISRDCCRLIVKGGKKCHMELMAHLFEMHQFKRFSPKGIFKVNEIWNTCSTY